MQCYEIHLHSGLNQTHTHTFAVKAESLNEACRKVSEHTAKHKVIPEKEINNVTYTMHNNTKLYTKDITMWRM